MSLPDEEIRFNYKEILSGEKFEYLSIKITEDDEMIFYKYNTTHTYCYHQYCNGEFCFKDVKKYKVLACSGCSLRIKIPTYIKTIDDLKRHFDKAVAENENSRFELLDL